MLAVGDVPDHTLMLTEMEGEPINYTPGVAGDFVSRRSVGYHDRIKGDGPMTGYATTIYENGAVYSSGGKRAHDQGEMGSLQRHRQTGHPQGGRHLYVKPTDKHGEFTLEMEGDYTNLGHKAPCWWKVQPSGFSNERFRVGETVGAVKAPPLPISARRPGENLWGGAKRLGFKHSKSQEVTQNVP